METRKIATVVIENNGAYLIMKRAPWMKYEPNLWSICAGTIEEGETAEQAALREGKEETGLELKVLKTGKKFETIVGDRKLVVFPVLAESKNKEVKINAENIAFAWIKPKEIWGYKIVPNLEKDFLSLGIEVGKPAQKKLF